VSHLSSYSANLFPSDNFVMKYFLDIDEKFRNLRVEILLLSAHRRCLLPALSSESRGQTAVSSIIYT
jgi:hypothetical protein